MFQQLISRVKDLVIWMLPLMLLTEAEVTQFYEYRGHGEVVVSFVSFEESARELDNPNRGFYHVNGFRITENAADFASSTAQRFGNDDTQLSLIEVNLQTYVKKSIGERGMKNLEKLFAELAKTDKNFIVRFLYDWDGKNLKNEPKDVEIILGHMEQAAEVVNRYRDRIFLMQGLFTGNWGEMNNTAYSGAADMKRLAERLDEVMDRSIFFSVRTPLQWRLITDREETGLSRGNAGLMDRLGLFNDGMLGNSTDWGTYGSGSREADGLYKSWERAEELSFQETLCKTVPNGGEVIVPNEYNDFENAVRDLRTMHVTYLNQEYDQKVLEKWKKVKVDEAGCFQGMDGKTYVERHLGYRILIDGVRISYDFGGDRLLTGIDFKNVGFAPIYRPADLYLTIRSQTGDLVYQKLMEQDIRDLAGGNETEALLSCSETIDLKGLPEGNYRMFVKLLDRVSGQGIYFANTANMQTDGYLIGEVMLGNIQDSIDGWKEEYGERTAEVWNEGRD